MKDKEIHARNLRLPKKTAQLIKKSADKNNRSVNGEIIAAIEKQIFDVLNIQV